MKKTFLLPAFICVLISSVYFTSCNNSDTASRSKEVITPEDSIKQVIAKGEYLTLHVAVCMHCHSQRDYSKFAGPVKPGTEGMGGDVFSHAILGAIPGTLYAKNITSDKETGIGDWTDGEIIRAITQGINKKGDTLFPIMPYANFNHMAKEDLLSIVAYLRTLKPIKNIVPARELMIPISMAYPAPALQKSIEANIRPAATDTVKYGGYLTTMAGCFDCHTAFVKGAPDFANMFAGGNTFTVAGFKVTSSNITPDATNGIGAWTEAMFISKFSVCREEKGYNYNPGKTNSVMPIVDFSGMKDADLKSIFAYLKTVKPNSSKVVKYQD
jgi:mono/diheme cytochrome c family protein